MVDLLESVYRGFPIGSILLWRVEEKIFREDVIEGAPFPQIAHVFPVNYVLDGMQRLATLYGAFSENSSSDQKRFDILFDLESERFVHRLSSKILPNFFVELADLFVPKRLMSAQQRLSAAPNGDALIEKTLHLYSTFQEYLVPMVTIQRRNVRDVVQMFERVNSTGLRLSSVDFLRAVTWSSDFDLSRATQELQSKTLESGLEISEETLVKMLALTLDLDPIPDQMLTLRDFSPGDLTAAVGQMEALLKRTQNFLVNHFKIESGSFVPYEGQLLAIFLVLLENPNLSENQVAAIKQWFWRVEFGEVLRGRPDHYVVREIRAIAFEVSHEEIRNEPGGYIEAKNFIRRGFRVGAALSAALATMFAVRDARSLVTGREIPPSEYMREFNSRDFVSIVPKGIVLEGRADKVNRFIANMAVISEDDRIALGGRSILDFICAPNVDERVLKSQLLDVECIELLRSGNFTDFVARRATVLANAASQLTGQPVSFL